MYILKIIYEKILEQKLRFDFTNKNNSVPLDDLINSKDKDTLTQYLKMNKLYNKEAIECILGHYRFLTKPKITNGNFIPILSIIIPIILAFVTNEGFDVKSFSASFPYILSSFFIFVLVYFPLKKIMKLGEIITGKNGLEEQLESIFSELYIEFVTKSINSEKETKKMKKNKIKHNKRK